MRYRFNEYEFNSDSLVLTKNGNALALRHTEAKVLALLLEQRGNVIHKDVMLSEVWQNKIVSEQVVFQNISNLRNLFGNDAIKTFPKRGYQWQLVTKVVTSKRQAVDENESAQITVETANQTSFITSFPKWGIGVMVLLIFTLFIVITSTEIPDNERQKNQVITLAYLPLINLDNRPDSEFIFKDNNDFDFIELTNINTEAFINNPVQEYAKLSQEHPLILIGKTRRYHQKIYLDFSLNGPVTQWQGQISGSSMHQVVNQLQKHLKHQVIYDLINKPLSPDVKQAKLSIAHQTSPDDLIILRELSITYFLTGEFDKAMAMTDKLIKLAQSQQNLQQIGRALAYQSKILTKKKLYELSAQKIKQAMEYFEKIDDVKYLARAWYYQSWLDDQQRNYPLLKASLLKSAKLAFDADNKLGEIDTLIHLAGKAHAYQRGDDKYHYLQQAERKIKAYQLPAYQLAKISYRYASFAKTLSEKEPHLIQALKLAASTPEHWVAQSSKKQLVQLYIAQNRLDQAQSIIDSAKIDNYNNSYLKMLMAQAKQDTANMVVHAQRSFEQAQLAGSLSTSLDVALLLCHQKINCDFYMQYINDNATTEWHQTNKVGLTALNR